MSMSRVRCVALVLIALIAFSSPVVAQQPPGGQAPPEPAPAAAPAATTDLIRVFLDCDRCDDEYMRQNVGFVDYVRDRESADFHVLVTTQPTGGGGTSWI